MNLISDSKPVSVNSSSKSRGGNNRLMIQHQKQKLRNIAITEDHYFALKALGQAGDSFNDVVGKILAERKTK